jgi:tetratricopeptide (TPR) repeat protein
MRRLLTRLRLSRLRLSTLGGSAATTALVGSVALALVVVGGALGPKAVSGRGATPAGHGGARTEPVDLLAATIARQQKRLRDVPGDWRAWAALSSAYLEKARVSADPTYYPKAEGAARESLTRHPDGNADALVALGALANARHDFTVARDQARAALAINTASSDAYGVLTDALTQLGDAAGATDAVQHMLDLRPGLAAYARASYDLEQRGRVDEATDLMMRALDDAVDPYDAAFCHNQLGDLAWQVGDVAGAEREYAAALAADPTSTAGQRGRARAAAATGHTDTALAAYADVTRRTPTPSDLLEYAELLRATGRNEQAAEQVRLATAAQALFTANGGVDGLATAALALAGGQPAGAVDAARAEWARRQHVDVADALAWALHMAGKDGEALPYAQRVAATGARAAGYAYHLGMIELALGQRDEARADLTRAVWINPAFSSADAPAARKALADLGAAP